ncbi:hypothetical protein [Microbulbifer hainanensis]|uniref:hypothetical protein n=1 Tax=Microbulbifer hainanensis TaxID=2735675 RepID=UPI00186802C9|nr:hypothetical protein [Microbulbifer hainanensis]
MRTLYLHIGIHKTGTSSLQLALKNYQSQLLAQGLEFACLGKKGNSSGAIDVEDIAGGLAFRLNERFAQLLAASRGERVIVSGEHFSFLRDAQEIDKVQKVCARYFDETRIIVYLRRQDRQAISFRQQAARGCARGKSTSSRLLGHSDGAFPELTADVLAYYDYYSKLRLWEESFGREALTVHVFEPHRLSGGDIVTDFAEFLGEGVVIPPCRVNEGIPRREFLLTHKLLQLGVAPPQIEKLKPFMREDCERLQPSRAAARAFFARFADSNRALNDHYLPHPSGLAFVDDFDTYPERGNDSLTLSDLADWSTGILAAGLDNPLGLRDALLAERLDVLLAKSAEDGTADSRAELTALRECLAQGAAIAPHREPWWRRVKPKKQRGR